MNKWFMAGLLVLACGRDPELPKVEISHKVACELKTSALVEAATKSGLTCEQAKPGLDLIVANDPDCKAYFKNEAPEIVCDTAR